MAAPPFAFAPDSACARLLQRAVKAQLGAEEDVLAEYIAVMLAGGKSAPQVADQLTAFLGDAAESFVKWLWRHCADHRGEYLASGATATGGAEAAEEVRARPRPDSLSCTHSQRRTYAPRERRCSCPRRRASS